AAAGFDFRSGLFNITSRTLCVPMWNQKKSGILWTRWAWMLMSSDSVFSRAAIAMIASQCMAYRFALLI
ncbi:hypothetical protein, partial [Enterobacter asburiae]